MLMNQPNSWGATDENYAETGQTVTPGTSGYGSYTTLSFKDSGTTLDWDAYEIRIYCDSTRASGVNRAILFKIASDPAGTPATLISGIILGNADATQALAEVCFPIFIPAGTTLGVSAYCPGSGNAVTFGAAIFGRPSRPEMVWAGSGTETLGEGSGVGVDLSTAAIGNGSLGTWTSVGTTTKTCRYWYLGAQLSTTDAPAAQGWLELGYGDATAPTRIGHRHRFALLNTEGYLLRSALQAHANVPAGSTLYVRGQTNADVSSDGINCTAIGVY